MELFIRITLRDSKLDSSDPWNEKLKANQFVIRLIFLWFHADSSAKPPRQNIEHIACFTYSALPSYDITFREARNTCFENDLQTNRQTYQERGWTSSSVPPRHHQFCPGFVACSTIKFHFPKSLNVISKYLLLWVGNFSYHGILLTKFCFWKAGSSFCFSRTPISTKFSSNHIWNMYAKA